MRERGNSLLRFLDRYLGIPLVFFLALFFKKGRMPKKIESIAILKTAGIGDTTILSAIIYDLQVTFPKATITLFTGKENHEMGKLIPAINVVKLPITSPWQAIKIVRKQWYSVFIDADPWPRINALFTLFSRTGFTIGFKTKRQGRHFGYDSKIEHSSKVHELENYRKLLTPFLITPTHVPKIPHVEHEKKRAFALHLFPGGSRAYLKMWEDEKWEKVIEYLVAQKYEVILTGAKKDREALKKFERPGVLNGAGLYSLKETSELLNTCVALISVDTGIMHLAGALGMRVIALFGPTSPSRWGAIGEKVVAITPPYPYTCCISYGFEKKCRKNWCMSSISFEMVKKALVEIEEEYENHLASGREGGKALAAFKKPLSETVPSFRS